MSSPNALALQISDLSGEGFMQVVQRKEGIEENGVTERIKKNAENSKYSLKIKPTGQHQDIPASSALPENMNIYPLT